MNVVLTDNPRDTGPALVLSSDECDCDCNCACPVDSLPVPVLSRPIAYYLELTPACNNRCLGCGNGHASFRPLAGEEMEKRVLDGSGWCSLVARLVPHAQYLNLTGGEPTLHPAFAGIVHTISELGVHFVVFTNGRWPDANGTIRFLHDAATCDGLLVSLHGPVAAVHEAFSGTAGSFDETAANIRRAVDAGLPVATSMVIHRHNWDRVGETWDLARRLGANHMVCNRFIGPSAAGLVPARAQLRTAISTIESLRATGQPIRFGNCIPQCFERSSSIGCTAGSTFATIDPWGQVRPCNHVPLIAGDLNVQSVEEIWQGQAMMHWRSLVPAGCRHCPAFSSCHGGCRAQALLDGQRQDPLIQASLTGATMPVEPELRLYAGLHPIGQFVPLVQDGMTVLVHKSQVVPVPLEGVQIVSRLDGSLTLSDIREQVGPRLIDWIGTLYRQKMVTWA